MVEGHRRGGGVEGSKLVSRVHSQVHERRKPSESPDAKSAPLPCNFLYSAQTCPPSLPARSFR